MRPAHFDLRLFRNRSAMVRIVDASSGPWGHINVDAFTFDWETKGGAEVF
jgi:hypothetical protein